MVDVVLFGILIVALIIGWRQGTIRVLASLGAVLLSYRLARIYSGTLAAEITARLDMLSPGTTEGQLVRIISLLIDTNAIANRIVQTVLFLVIFIVVHWLIKKLANLLTGVFHGSVLGSINRAIGALLGLILACLAIVIVHSILLPTLVSFGVAGEIAVMLDQSDTILPLLYAIPRLI